MKRLTRQTRFPLCTFSLSVSSFNLIMNNEKSNADGGTEPTVPSLGTDPTPGGPEEAGRGLETAGEKSAQAVETSAASEHEAVEYPTGLRLALINLSLCLSIFLTALVCLFPIEPSFFVWITDRTSHP